MDDTDAPQEEQVLDFAYNGSEQKLKGWVRMRLVNNHRIEDSSLPFERGALIQIVKSPSPSSIPDGSIAMFLDYNYSTYKVDPPKILVCQEEAATEESQMDIDTSYTADVEKNTLERVQYKMKVLYNEKVVELFNAKPGELGENYIPITNRKDDI